MAAGKALFAKEDRRLRAVGAKVDIPFLMILLLVLVTGLTMLYSASYAQSLYDSGFVTSTRYLQKQAAFALLGLAAMAAISRIRPEFW